MRWLFLALSIMTFFLLAIVNEEYNIQGMTIFLVLFIGFIFLGVSVIAFAFKYISDTDTV